MKIACISTSRVPSSTANSIQVMKTCQGIARSGHDVALFVPAYDDTIQAFSEMGTDQKWKILSEQYGLVNRFQISWLPANPMWKRNDFAYLAVRRVLADKMESVYTWTVQSAVFGIMNGLPVIYEMHDLPTGKLGPLWFRMLVKIRGRKRLLSITRALVRSYKQRFSGLDDLDIIIAPNGVDLNQYQSLPAAHEARKMIRLPDAITILCAGHLYAGRGLDLFLGLAGQFPQHSFVWVGGRPDDVDEARRDASRLNLSNVIFTGYINNQFLPGYQAAADVLLMPYGRQIEGSGGGNSADICSPMKMFDYLATGRAILSSDLPVIHEVLNDTNAMFAAPEDLSSWVKNLSVLLEQPALRQRLAEQARADAAAYSWQARAERALEKW